MWADASILETMCNREQFDSMQEVNSMRRGLEEAGGGAWTTASTLVPFERYFFRSDFPCPELRGDFAWFPSGRRGAVSSL